MQIQKIIDILTQIAENHSDQVASTATTIGAIAAAITALVKAATEFRRWRELRLRTRPKLEP